MGFSPIRRDRLVGSVSNPCLGYQGIAGFHFHSYSVLCSSQLWFMIATGFCSGAWEIPTSKGKWVWCGAAIHPCPQIKISLFCVCSALHLNWRKHNRAQSKKSSKIMRGLFYVVLKTFWKSNYCDKFGIAILKIPFNLWAVEVSTIKHIDLYFSCSAIKIIAVE